VRGGQQLDTWLISRRDREKSGEVSRERQAGLRSYT